MISARATMEQTRQGIGVSASARKYMRYAMPEYAQARNEELNEVIVADFLKSKPWHRFILSKTFQGVAEVRKSASFSYIAIVRDSGAQAGYDIIVIQPAIKEPSEDVRKKRLEPGWGFKH